MSYSKRGPRERLAINAAIGTPRPCTECSRHAGVCGVILTKRQGRTYRKTDADYDHTRCRGCSAVSAPIGSCAQPATAPAVVHSGTGYADAGSSLR